jgi:hypothetical protein
MTVNCGLHGDRLAAIVCRHHVEVRNRPVGFVENSADPDDRQAWCDDCKDLFLREGDLTEKFREFNNFAVVCIDCYMQLRSRHGR